MPVAPEKASRRRWTSPGARGQDRGDRREVNGDFRCPTFAVNLTAVAPTAAVVSCEAPIVSGNAAVACQLIRAIASFATGVSGIAAVHSHEARVAIGFGRVA